MLPPPQIVEGDEALCQMVEALRDEPLLAIDTEANSMYSYETRVCLVQISSRSADYIIDPFTIRDTSPLGHLLADPQIEKVFHAAEYDLVCLHRQYGFKLVNLFDTMLAARVLNAAVVGLADLLQQHFGVQVDKSHQQDNWAVRPLSDDSLRYAQMDTHYLLALRDKQRQALADLGRLEEAQEVFNDVLLVEIKPHEFDPDGFWRLTRADQLTRRQMALLRELYLLRDDIARHLNLPPFKVIENYRLIQWAIRPPSKAQDINLADGGLHPQVVKTYSQDIVEAIKRGYQARLPTRPTPQTPDPIVADRYVALHDWRKAVAQQRRVEANIIMTKHTLWELARRKPLSLEELGQIRGLGAWRVAQYGDALLQLLARLK
ncbi:MAG: HRDC domain-containing protein [Anaerolineae bacterium]|nr:HRDC domain-containing protein [Anaerolineae bacterium]MDW8172642.1 HRDC domain-containing protein [Anaerolineae bacterium]